MSFPFNPASGLIVVSAEVVGPTGKVVTRLALDTGATKTLINGALLLAVGHDPALAQQRAQVTTGSGVEYVPCVVVDRLRSLGHEKVGVEVLGHTLPTGATVDGVLGLNFLRDHVLTIDFWTGQVSLT